MTCSKPAGVSHHASSSTCNPARAQLAWDGWTTKPQPKDAAASTDVILIVNRAAALHVLSQVLQYHLRKGQAPRILDSWLIRTGLQLCTRQTEASLPSRSGMQAAAGPSHQAHLLHQRQDERKGNEAEQYHSNSKDLARQRRPLPWELLAENHLGDLRPARGQPTCSWGRRGHTSGAPCGRQPQAAPICGPSSNLWDVAPGAPGHLPGTS